MMRHEHLLHILVVLCAVGTVHAQHRCRPDRAGARQAEFDGPKLVEVLELKPGMTVADVGSGFGAMTVVLGIGSAPAACSPPTLPRMRCDKRASTRRGKG